MKKKYRKPERLEWISFYYPCLNKEQVQEIFDKFIYDIENHPMALIMDSLQYTCEQYIKEYANG